MLVNKISEENVENLKKLIGSRLLKIYIQGGEIEKYDGIVIFGRKMIAMIFEKDDMQYKLRMEFHKKIKGIFYIEFYEWEKKSLLSKRHDPDNEGDYYVKNEIEDFKKFPISIGIEARPNEDFYKTNFIKSIKVYHYQAKYEIDSNEYDFVSVIGFETETGREIFIEKEHFVPNYNIYIDESDEINANLEEVHSEPGETFGKKEYQLIHHLK